MEADLLLIPIDHPVISMVPLLISMVPLLISMVPLLIPMVSLLIPMVSLLILMVPLVKAIKSLTNRGELSGKWAHEPVKLKNEPFKGIKSGNAIVNPCVKLIPRPNDLSPVKIRDASSTWQGYQKLTDARPSSCEACQK
jgi:hypothetical protein